MHNYPNLGAAFQNAEYEKFRIDPNEHFKQNNRVNLQYSLIHFTAQSYLKPSALNKIKLFDGMRQYYNSLKGHKSHSNFLLGMNVRDRQENVLVCLMCLNCHEILGVPLYEVKNQMVSFKESMRLIWQEFRVFFEWDDMRRDFRSNKIDFNSIVDKLEGMFDPED